MRSHLITIILLLNCILLFAQNNSETISATIIGSGSPKYNAERSGPSVLISYMDSKILVDMGNGTQANLNRLKVRTKKINGLLFTHHHLDHNEEFTPIFIHALLGGSKFTIAGPNPTSDFVSSIVDLYQEDIEYRMKKSNRTLKDVKNNYNIKDLKGGESFTIGEIKVTATKVNHTIYTIAYRFDAGGKSIVISGDLTYSESLSKLAKNANYLIMDSGGTIKKGSTKKKKGNENKKGDGSKKKTDNAHVNLVESSRMAKEANVKNLVLTHFTTGEIDFEATKHEIEKNYIGNIIFAEDFMQLPYTGPQHQHGKGNLHSHTTEQQECVESSIFKNEISITEDKNNDLRVITSNSIPNHSIGKFPNSGNPNTISEQSKTYKIDLTPKKSNTKTFVYDNGIDQGKPNYVFGVINNGVKIEPSANEFFRNKDTNQPNYNWTYEALSTEVNLGDDCNNAHVQPNGEYHYHGTPTGFVSGLSKNKMNLIGWAADGFPIYYKFGYKNANDPSSELVELKPSYKLKSGNRNGDGSSAPDGHYTGLYVQDYEFVNSLGDLDECNGRTGITPEFPNGTYYYVITDEFPSASRCMVGYPSDDFKIGKSNGQHKVVKKPQDNRNQNGEKTTNKSNKSSFETILKRMDVNKDDRISQSEAKGKLKQNFSKRDKNSDGYISREELKKRN